MKEHTKPAVTRPTTTVIVSASRRLAGTLVLAGIAVTMVAGCKHSDEQKKRKPKRYRDPVEQRVFYDGWWLKR